MDAVPRPSATTAFVVATPLAPTSPTTIDEHCADDVADDEDEVNPYIDYLPVGKP